MYTDLFAALLDKGNPRGHPILAALLYAYCPAAARWWLAGADPVTPFDPLWQALEDLISGKTLKEALSAYGFESLIDVAQTYVGQVDIWRDRHPGIHAPELLPTFPGGRIEVSRRFGHRAGIRKFGDRWENFFAYVRAWAFVACDWENDMRFPEKPRFSQVRLALTLSGIRRPAYFQAWSWMGQIKSAQRVTIGMVSGQDQLRLGLARRTGLVGDKPWASTPEVWVLDEKSGKADHFNDRLPEDTFLSVVEQLVDAAQKGPHPPLKALKGADQCNSCGFRAQCFRDKDEISLLSLSWSDNAHSRSR